mmetsp:Transcript_21279/g.24622  ORF Transcript_21279/g.24622 Transcript_21279/m.24622 type:complete len:276 (+) Transcript_21279:44-871(+)
MMNEIKSSSHKRKHDTAQSVASEDNETCSPIKASSKKVHGRRGDPRMNKAVEARLKNPQMSLLEALVVGGFKFIEQTSDAASKKGTLDEDNILLSQRKNQLSRRIRATKRRWEMEEAERKKRKLAANEDQGSTMFSAAQPYLFHRPALDSFTDPLCQSSTPATSEICAANSLHGGAVFMNTTATAAAILMDRWRYQQASLLLQHQQQLQNEEYIRRHLQCQVDASQESSPLCNLNRESLRQQHDTNSRTNNEYNNNAMLMMQPADYMKMLLSRQT